MAIERTASGLVDHLIGELERFRAGEITCREMKEVSNMTQQIYNLVKLERGVPAVTVHEVLKLVRDE